MTSLRKKLKPIGGVSVCLLDERVRFDSEHKLQPRLEQFLSSHLNLQMICPEVSAGLRVPSSPINLQNINGDIRAIISSDAITNTDVSDRLTKVAFQFLNSHRNKPLCGYIFKSRSPSCGSGSTPISGQTGGSKNGLFANHIAHSEQPLAMAEENWLVNEERHYRFLTVNTNEVLIQRY